MNTIERSITISAPLHQVFEFVRDPVHLTEICPSLLSIETIFPLNEGGKDFRWKYRLLDVGFEGVSRTTEVTFDQCLVNRIEGGITGIVTWMFYPEHDGILVTLNVEYNMPVPLLRRHSPAFIAEENESAVEAVLRNLKAVCEGVTTENAAS